MNQWIPGAKRLYQRLPMPVRTWAASAYGFVLDGVRYGRDAERRVQDALAREGWSAEAWRAWHRAELAAVLDRAATRVPYYREQWRRRREAGDDAPWTELANWPVLEKEPLRRDATVFVADDVDRGRLLEYHTSGTTGTALTLWRSVETNRAWYALYELRCRRWYGVGRGDRWAILGAQPVVPIQRREPPFWIWNAGLRQLYLSTFHVQADNVAAYLEALRRHRVTYLLGYPNTIASLVALARERGVTGPRLRVMISNAEHLGERQRREIGEYFGCPVRNTYGMVELAAAGSECDHGVMHLWPDAGIVEVVDDATDAPVAAGEVGSLVCTGLLNRDMPLIRYRVGDRGALENGGGTCGCGRTLPAIRAIEGRTSDLLIAADGRRHFALAGLFQGLPIVERQTIQHAVEHIEVLLVPDETFSEEHERVLRQRFVDLLGEVDVQVRRVEQVPRAPNGKFRALVSHVEGGSMTGGGG